MVVSRTTSRVSRPLAKGGRGRATTRDNRRTDSVHRKNRVSLIQSVFLAAVVFLVASPTVRNQFVSLDDFLYLGNPAVKQGVTPAGVSFAFSTVSTLYWHPLTWISHELDVTLFSMRPVGHHFTSLLLHAISAGLLFLILRRLGAGAWSAVGGALFWALHPLRVESFAWTAERKDVLCAVFFLATILAYLRYAKCPSLSQYLAWTGLGALTLMSKPTAVSLVAVLLLLDYWPLRRTPGILKLLWEKVPLLMMTTAIAFLTVYGQKTSGSLSHLAGVAFLIRIQNAPVFYVRYIGKLIWPVNLSCFYPYDMHPRVTLVVGSVLLLSTITLVSIFQRHRRPWLLAGWLWFLVALLPNIGLIQAGRQSIADRFTHMAMIGITIAIVFTVTGWATSSQARTRITVVLTCCSLALFVAFTQRQTGFWHDSIRLYSHAIAVQDSDYMRGVLAAALIGDRRYPDAEAQLLAAIRLAPDRFEHHNNLASVLLRTGRVDSAVTEAAIALRLAPDELSTTQTMGAVLLRRAEYVRAIEQLDHAIRLGANPLVIAAELNDMGASIASRGHPSEAEQLIRKAIELNPALVQARRNLVLVLEDQGRLAEARVALHVAIVSTGFRPEYAGLERSDK